MQSRLEEEEEAKAALMSRIQRLTKLILVSTKNTIPGLDEVPTHQQYHSVGEDDVSCPFQLRVTENYGDLYLSLNGACVRIFIHSIIFII